MTRPPLQRRARAFTLLELVLSTFVMSIVLMAMGSTILLASKGLPGSSHPLEERIAAAAVVGRMASELESALFVTERTATAITVVVPDRDSNGKNETIRYAWSGTSGHALTRSYNAAAAVAVLTDVRSFALTYAYNTVTESYPNASGTIVTSSRYQVSEVRIAVRGGPEATSRAETLVKTYNLPDCVTAAWDADFSRSPTTLDILGTGTNDWARRDGAAFSTASLVGGVWRVDAVLDTRPVNNFTALTTIEADLRTTATGDGGMIWINGDWSGGQSGSVYFTVRRESDGTQTLQAYRLTTSSSSSAQLVLTVSNLSSGFIKVRLIFDPVRRLFNVCVNGMQRGTYSYAKFSGYSTAHKHISMETQGAATEIARFSARVWSGSP